jgi:UDP-N-acetylglucosamine acyltransferase
VSTIHPTALVDPGAEIASGARIGPWCQIGPGVRLDEDVELVSQVIVERDTYIGARNQIHPQHTGYKGEPVRLEIGTDNVIREHATFNRGTPGGHGVTRVGSHNFFMTGAHVGHDCVVGDNIVFANQATLGGHAEVGDRVFLGGLSAVHQFGRVGTGAMVGGLAAVTRDVIPFGSVWGNHARLHGLNMVGLKRRGVEKAVLKALLAFYRELFEGEDTFEARLERVRARADLPEEARTILAFIEAGGRRPLCLPEA